MRLGTYYRAALLERLGLRGAHGRVLDVGGHDGFWLSTLKADQLVTVDIEVFRRFDEVRYLQGDGLRLPFRHDSFDTVFALDVLEHVDDDRRFVAELMRVLRPGGRLILTTPHEEIRIFPGLLTPWANRRWQHYRTSGYTPDALADMFSRWCVNGLRIRQLETRNFRHFYLPLSVVWRLWRAPGRLLTRWFASLDSRQAEAAGGYLLAELVK